jgi:ATP-dependent protease HslVU (ClpYQ) peptidase subunit
MTTIAGIQGDGFAVIGSDTRISSYGSDGSAYQYSHLGPGTSKIAARGKFLLGAAGDLRAINLLHHVYQPPTVAPSLKGKKLDSFVTGKVIPSLRQCFDTQGYSAPEKDSSREHKAEQGSTIILVVNGTIYIIEEDYSWTTESTGLYACGTGSSYALGALYATTGGKNLSLYQSKQAVIKALSTAAKFDPYSGGPYHTFVQQSQDEK